MTIKKSLLVAGAIATVGMASTAIGVQAATTKTGGESNLVDKIAQRFNLNKDDVQEVFDENHKEIEAEHKADMEERLDQAVTDGKLTKEQKAKILAKISEFEKDRPDPSEFEDKTPKQIHKEMKQKHKDLKKWAEDNDIPEEYLPFAIKFDSRGPGPVGGHGHGEIMVRSFGS